MPNGAGSKVARRKEQRRGSGRSATLMERVAVDGGMENRDGYEMPAWLIGQPPRLSLGTA